MIEGLITVVLPVFNEEKYLDRCVESIVGQTYSKLEILLVDDGSEDLSPEKCDAWAEKDPRVRVIHKSNAGLGMARNTGIDSARGQYILFVDSDDFIAADTVRLLYDAAVSYKAELVLFGSTRLSESGKTIRTSVPCTEKSFYSGTEVREFILPNLFGPDSDNGRDYGLMISACSCLFSMEGINKSGWRFVSERDYISEDAYSLLELFAQVQSVAVVRKALYYYCMNGSSLTHAFRTDRLAENLHLYSECVKLCEKYAYSENVKAQVAFLVVSNMILAMKIAATADEPFKRRIGYIRDIVENPDFQLVLKQANKKGDSLMRRTLTAAIERKFTPAVYALTALKRKTE